MPKDIPIYFDPFKITEVIAPSESNLFTMLEEKAGIILNFKEIKNIGGGSSHTLSYLTLPDKNNIRYQEEYIDFSNRTFVIYLNDVPIIKTKQTLDALHTNGRMYTAFTLPTISQTNLEIAMGEKKEKEEYSRIHFTSFQIEARNTLSNIYNALFDENEKIDIDKSLEAIKQYRTQNPKEFHNVLVDDKDFQILYALFPDWTNPDNTFNFYRQFFDEIPENPEKHMKELAYHLMGSKKVNAIFKEFSEPYLENTDPVMIQLKRLCYDYADELFIELAQHPLKDIKHKNLIDAKISALRDLRQALDEITAIKDQPVQEKIEAALKKAKPILKQDEDAKAIRFLKQFARILKAAFTLTYSAKKAESLAKTGSHKFWKSEKELRGVSFSKDIKRSLKK